MIKLEPTRNNALVDLIDRIMVKGVILHADLVISVSGIPLVGVNLRAAIAGMKTMLDYGMMEAWDEEIRRYAQENNEEVPQLKENEEIVYKTYASYHNGKGSFHGVWRSGYLYLTDKRLFLYRKNPPQILFEAKLDKIEDVSVERGTYLTRKEELLLLFTAKTQSSNDLAVLHTGETTKLKRMIENRSQMIRVPSVC